MATPVFKRYYPRDDWNARKPRDDMAPQPSPTEAFLHHSDDPHGSAWVTMADQIEKVQQIQDFHMNVRGWSDIAYHFLIFQHIGAKLQSRIFQGRAVFWTPAAQLNHNHGTLAICVVGNGQAETLSRNTRFAIEQIIKAHPTVKVLGGHRDVVATTCPGDIFYRDVPRIAAKLNLKTYKGS